MFEAAKKDLELLEREFSVNNYKGASDNAPFFAYRLGSPNSHIFLSVPHCVCHTRDGDLRLKEAYTGALGKYITNVTECHFIYKLNTLGDPNYDAEYESSYKQKIREVIESNNIRLFLDLHGMPNVRDIDICLATNDGDNINNTSLDLKLMDCLKAHFNVAIDDPFNADSDLCLTTWVNNEFFVPAIQIKLAERVRQSPNSMVDFIDGIVDFINKLNY